MEKMKDARNVTGKFAWIDTGSADFAERKHEKDEQMNKEELTVFLKESMSVSIDIGVAFGPVETVTVRLSLDGVVFSEDSCILPVPEK